MSFLIKRVVIKGAVKRIKIVEVVSSSVWFCKKNQVGTFLKKVLIEFLSNLVTINLAKNNSAFILQKKELLSFETSS